jgi:uncharacterized protein YyaL (SSP411 family)
VSLLAWLACASVDPAQVEAGRPALGEEPAETRVGRLASSSSPYLRQHADNPVDWYPWGPEAFEAARARDVPIFLSIGYAACHWCHVMEHESFEDPETAAYMNDHFVCVKVDREQRPDVDALYMDAVYLLHGSGGWPASLWLDTELRPFAAGTYFPSEAGFGRPSFMEVLAEMSAAWRDQRPAVLKTAEQVQQALSARALPGQDEPVSEIVSPATLKAMEQDWDHLHAGWGSSTKFPMAPRLELLLEHEAAWPLLAAQLDVMDRGGLHDHLGGGFHRYTVDRTWTVPHFEKMLYDNAQLLGLYAEASQLLASPQAGRVAEGIADYLIRDMQAPDGSFWSSEDADSAGEEGTFYVWTPAQVRELLPDPEPFLAAYALTDAGNFEGSNVLFRQPGVDVDALAEDRHALFLARLERTPPPTDTKSVVAWNGLTLGALARSGSLLGRPHHIEAAERAAEAVLRHQREDGRLPRTLDADSPEGTLEDYAFLAEGLLDLYEATGDPRWLLAAEATAERMLLDFSAEGGGFYQSPPSAEELLARRQDPEDGSEPSGWGRAMLVLARLQAFGSPVVQPQRLQAGLDAAAIWLRRAPASVPSLIRAHDRLMAPSIEVVLIAQDRDDPRLEFFRQAALAQSSPRLNLAVAGLDDLNDLGHFSAFANKLAAPDGGPMAYVCVDKACHQPTTELPVFIEQLEATRR